MCRHLDNLCDSIYQFSKSEKHHQNICKWDLVLFPSSHRMQWCKLFQKRKSYDGDKSFFPKKYMDPTSFGQHTIAALPTATGRALPPSATRRALSSSFFFPISSTIFSRELKMTVPLISSYIIYWRGDGDLCLLSCLGWAQTVEICCDSKDMFF